MTGSPFRDLVPGEWYLTDGHGKVFGPFTREQIRTRVRRYLHYRRFSEATRRACWSKAARSPVDV